MGKATEPNEKLLLLHGCVNQMFPLLLMHVSVDNVIFSIFNLLTSFMILTEWLISNVKTRRCCAGKKVILYSKVVFRRVVEHHNIFDATRIYAYFMTLLIGLYPVIFDESTTDTWKSQELRYQLARKKAQVFDNNGSFLI